LSVCPWPVFKVYIKRGTINDSWSYSQTLAKHEKRSSILAKCRI